MKVEVNINKRYFFGVLAGILVLAGIIAAYAYTSGSADPAIFGHSINEIAAPSGCSAGQILQWTGVAWTCNNSTNGGGNNQSSEWVKIADAMLNNQKSYTFTGLNGDSQLVYKIVVYGEINPISGQGESAVVYLNGDNTTSTHYRNFFLDVADFAPFAARGLTLLDSNNGFDLSNSGQDNSFVAFRTEYIIPVTNYSPGPLFPGDPEYPLTGMAYGFTSYQFKSNAGGSYLAQGVTNYVGSWLNGGHSTVKNLTFAAGPGTFNGRIQLYAMYP